MSKRIFDILASGLGLVIFSPVIIIVAILVRYKLGSPILFHQSRPGLNGEIFNIKKFRTMLDATDFSGNSLPDNQRLTRFGMFLRVTSLDELPELWNVLIGEMSMVGPRPLLIEYLPLYNEFQAQRHKMRPGITGWAQINGRNAVLWDEKFNLDIWYVENQSFWLDIKILLLTVKKVLMRDDITSDGHVTAEKFKGNAS